MSTNPPPTTSLPLLPEPLEPDRLQEMEDAALEAAVQELEAAERVTRAAMAPYDQQLRELRARTALIATERRRRERAARHAARMAVRERARSGEMPALVDALEAPEPLLPDDRPLAEVRAFLTTGGEVRFGYPTRPGSITFTDGRSIHTARTWGEARSHHAAGLEPGTTSLPGVRVHLTGTRIEKVVGPTEILVETAPTPRAAPAAGDAAP